MHSANTDIYVSLIWIWLYTLIVLRASLFIYITVILVGDYAYHSLLMEVEFRKSVIFFQRFKRWRKKSAPKMLKKNWLFCPYAREIMVIWNNYTWYLLIGTPIHVKPILCFSLLRYRCNWQVGDDDNSMNDR